MSNEIPHSLPSNSLEDAGTSEQQQRINDMRVQSNSPLVWRPLPGKRRRRAEWGGGQWGSWGSDLANELPHPPDQASGQRSASASSTTLGRVKVNNGKFLDDAIHCATIHRRTCESAADCSCFGFYTCERARGRCVSRSRLQRQRQRGITNPASDDESSASTSSGRLGTWLSESVDEPSVTSYNGHYISSG